MKHDDRLTGDEYPQLKNNGRMFVSGFGIVYNWVMKASIAGIICPLQQGRIDSKFRITSLLNVANNEMTYNSNLIESDLQVV